MSQGVAVCNCLPKTAWPPTSTRIAIVAGLLLAAGIARADSSVPTSEEKILETGAPVSAAHLDYTGVQVSSKALTAALIQVPDEDRGNVETASFQVASNQVWPTKVDDRDRR